jgi:sugar phosphate permease
MSIVKGQEGKCFLGCLGYLAITALVLGLIYSVAGWVGVFALLTFLGICTILIGLAKKL